MTDHTLPLQSSAVPNPAAQVDDRAKAARQLRQSLRRVEQRKKWVAITLTLPLLIYLLVTLVVPIGALLTRAVENPEVASTLSRTVAVIASWDRKSPLPDATYAAVAQDLAAIGEQADAGALARRLNSEIAGGRSLVMKTVRAMPLEAGLSPAQVREKLLELDERWGEPGYWQAIAKNASRWTPDYLLTSVDLKRDDVTGEIVQVDPESAAFSNILLRTFSISATVTVFCLLLGYPLAYWLSTLSARAANVMMILVLVPFWTSILVRSAAWIVLLQNNGLVNRFLQAIGLIDAPLPLLFNRVGVVIAMVHILLPFMILPLYSVMKTVPPTYLRAAVSLGSTPLAAFFRVYVPQTYPGVGAGGLLVFILSIGYYVTPALLGGADDQMLSYYIAQYTNVNVNWGMACALGAVLLSATLVLYAVYRRVVKSELSLG